MINSIFKYLMVPMPGAKEAEVFRWRLVVFAFTVVLAVHIVWAVGYIPGFSGVATAEDVDNRIQKVVAPLQAQVSQNNGYLKTLVLSDYAESIRGEIRARCVASDINERRRINRNIENKQAQYEKVAGPGKRYPEPDCEDL